MGENQSSNKIVKFLYIGLAIFILYLFYNKLIDMIMNFFNSNPTFYNEFLYFYLAIKNNTLPGLFYVSILGALFFLGIPMEAIFIYYLTSTQHNPIFIILVIVLGSIIGLFLNYILGWLLGSKLLKKMFNEETYEKYNNWILKYGGPVLLIGNIIPSPIEPITLMYGSFGYDYKKFIIYSFIGRLIKYLLLFIAFYFFWDQLTFLWDEMIQKINPFNYISF